MLEMLSSADPLFLYAVAGVVVLAIASLFGLVLFASREETFEDVVEKQRKAQEALLNSLQQGSGKSGKQNKKWKKLKNNKTSKPKASDEHEQDSGVDDDEISTETVTINTPPPTIAVEEPALAPAASKKKSKKGKKNKQATEDVKVDDVVEDLGVVEEVVVEEEIAQVEAEPELECLPEEEPEAIVEEEIVIEEEPAVLAEPEVVAEPVQEPVKIPEPVAAEKSKASKKKKAPKKVTPATNGIGKVMTEIQELHMQAEEVQQLMDALVEKQNELDQWTNPKQKTNPTDQMKKRITELETQFAEERLSSQAISNKLKEAKVELQQERNARQGMQNEAQNRINQTAQEGETIRKRLEEKHVSDMHSAQSQISRMQQIIDDGATNHMELQRMKEENAHMKNASMMAQQLAEDKQSLMTELSQCQQANRALRAEFDNLIIQHQQEMQNIQIAKAESEGALTQRLQEMNEQLMKSEAHNRNLQLGIAEQQRMAEEARTESETFQMAAKPDESATLAAAESLAKLSAAEAQLAELTQKCQEYEIQLTAAAAVPEPEAEPEVEVVSSATEIQELAAKCAEKDQMILQLEARVSEMTTNQTSSGQQSPDLVVVTPGDLLGSNESFEEVNPEGEVVEEVVVPEATSEQLSAPPTAEIEEMKATITSQAASIAEKQSEIDQLQAKILATQEATPAEPAVPAVDVDALMQEITQLKETITAKDAEIAAKDTTPVEEEGPTKDELKEQLATVKAELQGRTDTTDELKLKNNELREKNWKVIDALDAAQKDLSEHKKSTNIRIIKGLKNIVPDFSIPKFEDNYEMLFKEFGEKVSTTFQAAEPTESAEHAEQVKTLTDENVELKKTNEIMNASQDEVLKSQQENVQLKEENANIKNVLIETESMLCRLQTGVDAEVQKWQAKVTEKDAELEAQKKSTDDLKTILSKHGYDLTTLESSLNDGQRQLMAEKEENTKIKTELSELEKSLQQKNKELEELSAKTSGSDELTELNSKLKKTISERDLLIREYKNVKDSNTAMEKELTSSKLLVENKDKEIEQLKVQTTTTTPVANGDKDAEIKNLTTQIEELKEELREQNDPDLVIVDIDPDNADNLKKEVEELSTAKASLVSKLEDIEKSYSQEDLESQLKLAQKRIEELEAAASKPKSPTKDESKSGTSV